MMENDEVILLQEINSKMLKLIKDFDEVVNNLTKLTKMVCQKKFDNVENEIKLHSHM